MTIGLVLSVVVAILAFFGLADSFFKRVPIAPWLGFVVSLLLIAGALIPNITIGSFSMNIGGFIVPVIGSVIFSVIAWRRGDFLKVIFAELVFSAIMVATRSLILPENGGMILATSLIVGFLGGIMAYVITRSRSGVLASVMMGIVLGDLIVNLIYVFGFGGYAFSMGTRGVFDALVIGCVFGCVMLEAVEGAKRTVSEGRVNKEALKAESGRDEYDEFFDNKIL